MHLVDGLVGPYPLDVDIVLHIRLLPEHFPSDVIFDEPRNKFTRLYRVERPLKRVAADSGRVVTASHDVLVTQDLASAHGR